MTNIEKVDVISGKAEMDRLAEMEVKPLPKNWLERVWFWIA
jgi:amino acid transporter